MRRALYGWMERTGDLGLIPEPILENLGKRHGNKYHILRSGEHGGLVRDLIETIEAGERGDRAALLDRLGSDRPSVRYWAATWLGNLGASSAEEALIERTEDPTPAVRISAALALCKLGHEAEYVPVLADHIDADNLITGMYAIRALEQVGEPAEQVLPAIKAARDSRYEFTRRIATRLTRKLGE